MENTQTLGLQGDSAQGKDNEQPGSPSKVTATRPALIDVST